MKKFLLFISIFLLLSCKKDAKDDLIDKKQDGESSFIIASYNILHDLENIPEHFSWTFRKPLLIDQVKRSKIDILCLQEDRAHQANDIQQGIGYQAVGKAKRILYDGKRFRVKTHGNFYLSETPDKSSIGWDAAVVRECTWALFNDRNTNRDFYVFNTHFDHIGVTARERSAVLVKGRIESIAKGMPAFLTGDLNTGAGTRPILTLSEILTDSRAASKTAPEGPMGTSNGMDPDRDFAVMNRIDYIFVSSKHVTVHRYSVLADLTNNIYPSDHFPVIIEAELKP